VETETETETEKEKEKEKETLSLRHGNLHPRTFNLPSHPTSPGVAWTPLLVDPTMYYRMYIGSSLIITNNTTIWYGDLVVLCETTQSSSAAKSLGDSCATAFRALR